MKKLAPHVQAAIVSGVQPKMASHVQAAIVSGVQPKMTSDTQTARSARMQPKTGSTSGTGQRMAPHVQAAAAAGIQPSRRLSQVIQHERLTADRRPSSGNLSIQMASRSAPAQPVSIEAALDKIRQVNNKSLCTLVQFDNGGDIFAYDSADGFGVTLSGENWESALNASNLEVRRVQVREKLDSEQRMCGDFAVVRPRTVTKVKILTTASPCNRVCSGLISDLFAAHPDIKFWDMPHGEPYHGRGEGVEDYVEAVGKMRKKDGERKMAGYPIEHYKMGDQVKYKNWDEYQRYVAAAFAESEADMYEMWQEQRRVTDQRVSTFKETRVLPPPQFRD